MEVSVFFAFPKVPDSVVSHEVVHDHPGNPVGCLVILTIYHYSRSRKLKKNNNSCSPFNKKMIFLTNNDLWQ